MIHRLIAALFVCTGMVTAATPLVDAARIAGEAQASYETGDYATALARYDSVAQIAASAALYFNIGNCYFKLNDVPHAILHYERALLLAPGDEDIQANLDLARTLTVDRVNEIPGFTLGTSWQRFRGGADPDQWSRRSLWGCLLFFTLLAGAVLGRRVVVRRLSLIGAGIALIATVAAVSFAWDRHREATAHDHAIILTPNVDVTSEPRRESTVLFVLHQGTKVRVLQERNGWTEVRLANGSVGWMPPGSMERI
jgi:hypothetical protein